MYARSLTPHEASHRSEERSHFTAENTDFVPVVALSRENKIFREVFETVQSNTTHGSDTTTSINYTTV